MSLFTRDRGVAAGSSGDDERTVRIAHRRFVRRQWARRWLTWRPVVAGLVLLGLVVAGAWLVFLSPVLAVAGVQVHGSSVLTPAAVRRAAAVPTGAPLATVDLDAVRERVRRLPAVEDADVSRSWPDRVRVDVTERRAVAVLETADGGRLEGLDGRGVVFRQFAERPDDLPVVRRGESGDPIDDGGEVDADALAEAATVAASLPAALAARVAHVEVHTVDRITLRLRGGREVRWGSADDSATKAHVLEVLLEQPGSYFDVSTPGQPILRR
ncbi:MAG TPA: FtsQ-type POTRA domain-containing protein [Nocardioidaceae bacterium]|nr:FtsQ-type POTRA domain-containing protein [Nocardioidaceae bacterium]